MKKNKKRMGFVDVDLWCKMRDRATIETQIYNKTITVTDIIIRAIEKEIKSFKPLIKGGKNV